MTYKNACIFLALGAILAILLISMSPVQADESSNGDPMSTTLYMTGVSDNLQLWAIGPDEDAEAGSQKATVDEAWNAGYVDVGTWYSVPLDKDLHVEGEINIVLFLNATDNDGPDVRGKHPQGGVGQNRYADAGNAA